MAKSSSGKCSMYDFCQLIYLNPMTPPAIAARMGRSTKPYASQKAVERFRKELAKAQVDVLMDLETEQEQGSRTWIVGYYIHDPFWRDKLEEAWEQ